MTAPAADREAHATLEACWDLGVRYFDTAPWYGRGLGELRLGRLLRDRPRSSRAAGGRSRSSARPDSLAGSASASTHPA
jgi:D-threo-aldose 1-dehydrogenase